MRVFVTRAWIALGLMIWAFCAHSVLAVEQSTTTNTQTNLQSPLYKPAPCEFEITFPSAPAIQTICEKGKCYREARYIHNFEPHTSVRFRAVCSAIGPDIISTYTPEVLALTLKAMTDPAITTTYETSFRDESTYKQAGLLGRGKNGLLDSIFIAQIWIGQNSAMSIEAELTGPAHQAADDMLSNVLKSAHKSTQSLQ